MATSKSVPQPEGKFRRSQVLTTYGPGALVDLLDYAVIINGIDLWRFGYPGVEPVDEPRLRESTALRLKGKQAVLGFRMPPAGDDAEPAPNRGITARLFPTWFVCQNTKCRALTRYSSLEYKGGRFVHDCGHRCVPVRFVQACAAGHVDDLNWIGFVHRGELCEGPLLKLDEGRTGDFSEVTVECEACGRHRKLIDLKMPEMAPDCRGQRPWLGHDHEEACERKALLIMRTASSAYFSQVESALSIPEGANALYDAVVKEWKVLISATAANLPIFRQIPDVAHALEGFPDAEVLAMVELVKSGKKPVRPPIRQAEYARFMSAPTETPGTIAPAGETFFARRADIAPIPGIERVVLAHKLREVRTQVGFTRLDFPSPSFTGEHDLDVRTAPLGVTSDWLPAVEVFGEGVFVSLDEETLLAWEARPAVQARADELAAAHAVHYGNTVPMPPFPGVRFFLLHSLAHLLTTAVALECGYSASAIRERIYCSLPGASVPMAALLLTTATPGTEGTLGGLVEQGRRLATHLHRALKLGHLCSNDPVCASHQPLLGTRQLDGAACHGCLYIAESSCEFFNRVLDRALVVPCLGHPAELAWFGATAEPL